MKHWLTPIGLPVVPLMQMLPMAVRDSVPLIFWVTLQQLTWPQLVAAITLPVCAVKQIINMVQFWKAANHLCDSDREERYAKQHGKDS